jgi:hypothetical protein
MAIYEHIKANGIRRAMTAAKGFDVNSAVAMANLYNIYRQEAREDRRFYKDKIGSDKSIRDIWVL